MSQKAKGQDSQDIGDRIRYKDYIYNSYNLYSVNRQLLRDVFLFVGALRFLFAPFFTNVNEVTCDVIKTLCCAEGRYGVNYWVGDLVSIVRAELGNLRRWYIPCAVDKRRMPPLARYELLGFVEVGKDAIRVNVENMHVIPLVRAVAKLVERWRVCGVRDVYTLSRCVDVPVGVLVDIVILLRALFPNLLEVYRGGSTLNDLFVKLGRVVKADMLWGAAREFVKNGVVVPNFSLLPRRRVVKSVRSKASRYAIPPLLAYADFKDSVVADVGCGFGTKGAASIRWGARHVVLIDVDVTILRERGNGLLIDRVVADAHMLPLRERSIDVTIFWNVLNFLDEPEKAIREIARVTRREVVFSVYNATSGRYVSYGEFLKAASMWGTPKVVKRLGNSQFQAIVKRYED